MREKKGEGKVTTIMYLSTNGSGREREKRERKYTTIMNVPLYHLFRRKDAGEREKKIEKERENTLL